MMAKRKRKASEVDRGLPKYIEKSRPTPKKYKIKDVEFKMCPRCRGFNTISTSTVTYESFKRFYRVCRSPICRHRYIKVEML